MTARIKSTFVYGLLAAMVLGGDAWALEPKARDNCAILAHYDANKTAKALFSFSMKIFGKHPERWTVADIENLMNNARICDNRPVEYSVTTRVFSKNWGFAFGEDKVKRFLAISNKSTQLAQMVSDVWPQGMTLPHCGDLLKWRRDPVWMVNNSVSIFGKSFLEAREEDSPVIKLYVNSCLPVMEGILKLRNGSPKTAVRITADIISGLDRDVLARRWNEIDLIPELQIVHEGQPIPLAYASETTRDVVLKINNSEHNKLPLDIDSLSTISSWIATMNRRNAQGPDAMFVAAVKQIVSRQLFQQERRYDDL